jgi:hypothetical protein
MASFAATSTASKTVSLTPDRVELLCGGRSINLVLLERVCQVKVEVLPLEVCVPPGGKEGQHAVVLTSMGSEDFGDKNFARKVHRFVKSSSRGGFIAWFPRLVFESSAQQSVRQKVRNAIDAAKSKFPSVECILQCLDMQWTDPAKMATSATEAAQPMGLAESVDEAGDEDRGACIPTLCLCVLPGTTAAAAAPGADAQLDEAIAWMLAAKAKGWKVAGGGGGGKGMMVFDDTPAPPSLKDVAAFRKLNTTQRNKVKDKEKEKQSKS